MLRILILFQLISFSFIGDSHAQRTWKLEKDSDGIKVFVRPNEGSDFDEFKATVTIAECNLSDALNVLLDIHNYVAWFPECANPKILEQKSKYHDIHYIETITPWPVDNRFGVYEQTTTLSNNDSKAMVVFVASPNYPMEVEGMVRITEARGEWILEQVGDSLNLTYQFKGNPGGSIPAWLANTFVVQHPFETLSSFKELME